MTPCPYCQKFDKVFALGKERRYCIRCARFYLLRLAKARQRIEASK